MMNRKNLTLMVLQYYFHPLNHKEISKHHNGQEYDMETNYQQRKHVNKPSSSSFIHIITAVHCIIELVVLSLLYKH